MVIWMRWHCPPDTWFEVEPCWSAAKPVISRSCRLPTIFNLYDWAGRKHFVLWNLECQSRRRICDLWLSKQAPSPRPLVLLLHTMADQKCARGRGVSHILAEKRLLASLYSKKMHENAIFFPIRGGGRTPGTHYAGSATDIYTNTLPDYWYQDDVLCILAGIYKLISKTVQIIDFYDIDDVLYWFKYINIFFHMCR